MNRFLFQCALTLLVVAPSTDSQTLDSLSNGLPDSEFGYSVAIAGDLNRDGWKDLVVGAPFANINGDSSGAAYIYFGGKRMTGIPDIVLVGPRAYDLFGTSVASAGDVNGDGYDDIIVGAPTNKCAMVDSPDTLTDGIGKAYIFFGGPTMVATPALVLTDGLFGSMFGCSVACAGDLNGDTYSDVIVGAKFGGGTQGWVPNGTALVYLGGTAMDSVVDLPLGYKVGGDLWKQYGYCVAGVGDLNKDGFDDFAVARLKEWNASPGWTRVYEGSQSLTGSILETLAVPDEGYPVDFGHSIAHGDFNGDGWIDILIGQPKDHMMWDSSFASCQMFPGSDTITNTHETYTSKHLISGHVGSGFGTSVCSIGDINRDGFDDFLVGAPFDSPAGHIPGGSVYLYYGNAVLDSFSYVIFPGVTAYGAWGYSIAGAADIDGDGHGELIIGAPGNDPRGSSPGRVYLVKTDYVTSTRVSADINLPATVRLCQNFPNPFNPTTMIRFGVPSRSMVRLVVYTLLGQQVAELINGEVAAGYHDVRFDSNNLASGTYIYRLTAPGFSQTKKFLLVR